MTRKPFERPDLTTPWQRLTSSIAVRIGSGVVLVAGSATLVAMALSRA